MADDWNGAIDAAVELLHRREPSAGAWAEQTKLLLAIKRPRLSADDYYRRGVASIAQPKRYGPRISG